MKDILNIQRQAWNKGHDNYGTLIDVKAALLYFLKYFKYLNSAQKQLYNELVSDVSLKYAKRLCNKAHKAARHYIVTLK